MIFLRYENWKQYLRFYPVTSFLLLANLVMFGVLTWAGSSQDTETLLRFGAMFKYPGLQTEAWRYVSSMFLHIGFTHLLFNCFAIYVFAPPLERLLGSWSYLVLYILSGVIGNIGSQWLHQDIYIGAGASGAIYGIYGAYLYLALFHRAVLDKQSRQTVTTILVVGVVQSMIIPNVDLYAHLGGFVGGMLLMAILVHWRKRRTL